MNKRNNTHCINRYLCCILLSKLQNVETKCDRITLELAEVRRMIVSLPPDIGVLIDSIERSAIEMHEQSIKHREYVEGCINGRSVHLIRRIGDGF